MFFVIIWKMGSSQSSSGGKSGSGSAQSRSGGGYAISKGSSGSGSGSPAAAGGGAYGAYISRAAFESNPKSYFTGLHAAEKAKINK